MRIELTEDDLKFAESVALQRNQSQRQAGRADGLVKGSSLGRDLQGAEAELAVSKALDLPWDGKWLPIPVWDTWKIDGYDVGNLEIRSTDLPNGRLILHHSDKDTAPYVLVISDERPIYKLVGWIYGSEGKQKQYWRSNVPRPCYMIPQSKLRDMKEIVEKLSNSSK